MEAAHSCNNRLCCNPKHLSWKTHSANELDKIGHGTSTRGVRRWNAKLTIQDVIAIRKIADQLSRKELGEMYGVHPSNINAIVRRRSWAWVQ
jgi:hypothetical protein